MWSKLLKRSVPVLRRAHAHPMMISRASPMAMFQRHFADKKVPLPSLGAESITEGEVTEWNVAVGDSVSEGDILCSIETDKVFYYFIFVSELLERWILIFVSILKFVHRQYLTTK